MMHLSTILLVLVLIPSSKELLRVIEHPADGTFCEGTTARLSCIIFDNSTGAANTTTWLNNTAIESIADDRVENIVFGNNVTSVLTLMDVSKDLNNSNYSCRPSRTVISSGAVITIIDKPDAPLNVIIPPEDIISDSFIVQWDAVADLFPITYTVRWYGENIDNTTTTNGLSYTVTGLTSNTSYSVTVVAINTCGAGPVSDVVMVTTAIPPVIKVHPMDVVIQLYSNFTNHTLSCEADGSSSYNWERQNGVIPSDSTGVNTNTLTLINLQPEDAGNYRCVATNASGSSESNYANLTINVPRPRITEHPMDNIIQVTQTAVFTCVGQGYGLVYVNWIGIINNDERPLQSKSKVNTTNILDNITSILTIPDLVDRDERDYRCIYNNSGGEVESNIATLTIESTDLNRNGGENDDGNVGLTVGVVLAVIIIIAVIVIIVVIYRRRSNRGGMKFKETPKNKSDNADPSEQLVVPHLSGNPPLNGSSINKPQVDIPMKPLPSSNPGSSQDFPEMPYTHMLAEWKGKFANTVEEIKKVFEQEDIDVNSLIRKLCIVDDKNTTIFSNVEVFKDIRSINDIFFHIGKYCNIFDYHLLLSLVTSCPECPKARKLLDDFTSELRCSSLKGLNLLNVEELRNPNDIMPGTHKLDVKYDGIECSIETEGMVRNAVCGSYDLMTSSLTFKGVEEGSIVFVYQITAAVKQYLQQYHIKTQNVLSEKKIQYLMIDGEELKLLSGVEATGSKKLQTYPSMVDGAEVSIKPEAASKEVEVKEKMLEDIMIKLPESIRQLKNFVKDKISDKWDSIAIHLEFSIVEIRGIKEDHKARSVVDCCIEMLIDWADRAPRENAANQLVEAIREVKLGYQADQIEKGK